MRYTFTEQHQKLLDELKARLASGVIFNSPDEYYNCKDTVRELEANKRGMRVGEFDPVGHWFGRMSN